MRVEIEVKGFEKDGLSVEFVCSYLIGGSLRVKAQTEDGVKWFAEIEGNPTHIRPYIMAATSYVDPNSDSTVTVEIVPE